MIVIKNIHKTFATSDLTVNAVDNVSLKIEDGEIYGVIGYSGAGKSTLVRCINFLEVPDSGSIEISGFGTISAESQNLYYIHDGKKVKAGDSQLRALRRQIGMIFQSFNLVTRTTVIKNVLTSFVPDLPFWRVLFGVFPKEMKIKSLEALDNMGILDKAYMRCDQLSGGQMQRVALARTLAQNPKIILADEPVAALDPVTARQVMDDFKKINKEMNISVLINIHHVDLALEYVDRIIGIKAGKIVYDGKASEIDNEILKEIYGGDLDKVGSSEDLLKRE